MNFYVYLYQLYFISMKITKRLSLLSTIHHRTIAPKPTSGWLERFIYSFRNQRQMTVEQELVKYGYTAKPRYNIIRMVIAALAIGTGLFVHLYLTNIYKNQLKARHKYRIQEMEHSSILLRMRRMLLQIAVSMQRNLFTSQILMRNQNKKLITISQAILRTEQYRNYMAKKDRKFEFMDIGILQKYPFPDIKETE